jgi:hypothetical protein
MEWLVSALVAVLDELSPKRTGHFREFLDDQAAGLAQVLGDNRRELAAAGDRAVTMLRDDSELIAALVEEIRTLNREVAEVSARNVVLTAGQRRLEAQHESDRAHIRELIAEMVRRDIR